MLLEVLVGTLLTLIFIGVSMQAIVVSMSIKVRAQELSESSNWIQEDFETVRQTANTAAALGYNADTGQYTVDASRCSATSAGAGYASLLQNSLAAISNPKLSELGQRPYTLTRSFTIKNTAPYNVLQVSYGVYRAEDTSFTKPIAKFYAEVIPGASFFCK